MKRFLCFFLAVMMVFSMVGCTSATAKQIREDANSLLSWWASHMDSNRILLGSDVYCIQSEDKTELVLFFTYVPRSNYERINCEIYQANGTRWFEFDGTNGFQNTQEKQKIDQFEKDLQGDLFQIIGQEEAAKVIGCHVISPAEAAKLPRRDTFEEKAISFFGDLCSRSDVIEYSIQGKTVTLTSTAAGITREDVEAEAQKGNDFSDISDTMLQTYIKVKNAFEESYSGSYSLILQTKTEDNFVFLEVRNDRITYRYAP